MKTNRNSLTAKLTEREKRKNEAPGRGWHSAAYHRHFEDWAEFERTDEKGRTRIERVYQGTWYVQSFSRSQRARERLVLVLLWALGLALFAFAALREVRANSTWFLAAAQFVMIGASFWTLTGLFNYLTSAGRMTVGEYKSGTLRFRRGCVVMIGALILCTLLYLLCALLYEGILQHLLCAALCLAAALPLLLAQRIDANVPYANEESKKTAPEDAALID